MELENIRVCDCVPAPSSMLMDDWRRFRADETLAALDGLRDAHPEANAVRIMHSYDAYLRDPDLYVDRWAEILGLCADRGFAVAACLFNRWHDRRLDCGGVYLESLIPEISWAYKEGFYAPFLRDVCGRFAKHSQIVLWETCNKPFGASADFAAGRLDGWLYETRWLREIYCYVKQTGAIAPTAISLREWYDERVIEALEDCCDVLLRSPCRANPEQTAALAGAALPHSNRPVITFEELL